MTPATATTFEFRLMHLQRTAAGFCIAVLLVAGLVSIPTSCDCGAGISHGHSLFILSGHHHGADGALFGADPDGRGHQHHDHDDYSHHTRETPSVESQAQLMGRIMYSSDRVVISIPLPDVDAISWKRVAYPRLDDTAATGQVITPDIPPPRV